MRIRRSARILAIDDDGHVLLFRAHDTQDVNSRPCWITPGGGVEEGEDDLAAACREMFEECGQRIEPADLIGPVAVSEGDWEFRGEPLHSIDTHYLLRIKTFDPILDNNVDAVEVAILGEHRWWHPDDLDTCTEEVFPRELASLIRDVHAGIEFPQPRLLPF